MNNMRVQFCCFTGHREIPPEQYNIVAGRLENSIIKLIENGVNFFIAGGALGRETRPLVN